MLLPFQCEFIEAVFAEGIQVAGLSVPRGNGKTGLLACIALSELFLNDEYPDIACIGVTLKQLNRPNGIYRACSDMVLANPVLREQVKVYRNNNDTKIALVDRPGELAAVAALDPDVLLGAAWSMTICDEFGASFWTMERWANIVQSGGKRGGDSRVIGISTPNSPDSAMYALRKRVLEGTAGPYVHWSEYAADENCDPYDRENWYKANPALGHHLSISALESDFELFADEAGKHYQFKMMRLGQWLEVSDEAWLGIAGMTAWDTTALKELPFSFTVPCFIGVDKSQRGDCSAVVLLQRDGDSWLSQAWIFRPNPVIDHAAVRDLIRDLCDTYTVSAVGYDPRYFVEGAQELDDEGLPMVEVTQSYSTLSPCYSELYRAIIAGQFYHLNDPDYREHMLNAVAKTSDDNEGIMLSKRRSHKKIDAAVATGIAIAVSGYAYSPKSFIYAL